MDADSDPNSKWMSMNRKCNVQSRTYGVRGGVNSGGKQTSGPKMNPFALDDALNTRARLGLPDAEDAPAPHESTTSFSYWPRAVSQRQIRIRYLPSPSGGSGASSSSHIRRPLHK